MSIIKLSFFEQRIPGWRLAGDKNTSYLLTTKSIGFMSTEAPCPRNKAVENYSITGGSEAPEVSFYIYLGSWSNFSKFCDVILTKALTENDSINNQVGVIKIV